LKKKRDIRKPLIIIIVAAIVLIGLILALTGFITDYLWFKGSIDQTAVFWKKLLTQITIGVPTFVVLGLLAFFYLKALTKGYKKRVDIAKESVSSKVVNWVSVGFSAAGAGVMTYLACTRLWYEWLQFTNSTAFDTKDPLFGLDVSFYVFKLQFIEDLNTLIIMAVVVFAVITFLQYYFLLAVMKPAAIDGEEVEDEEEEESDGAYQQGGMIGQILKGLGLGGIQQNLRPKTSSVKGGSVKELMHIASKQIIAIGVVFFLMIGVNYLLKQFELLYSGSSGSVYGASFTDVNITLWVYRIIMVLAVVAAVLFGIGVAKKKFRTMLTVPVVMIVIGLAGTGVAMLVQTLIVAPDELSKEQPYLQNNITFTQRAYDLQDVTVKEFAASDTLKTQDIINNIDTFRNIRINDYDPTKLFYNSTQTIRQYYTFNDVDVDRYMVNGRYTQTFLSARELNEDQINQQWLNLHIKYTHGYGIVLSRVDKVTASGQPDIMIENIPPVSTVDEIPEISRPEIYFGELQKEYIITGTDEEEFDYPDGDSNQYTMFEGDTGVSLNAFNRLFFSIQERSMKLLVSSNISSQSKIHVNRDIKQRVVKIMPYLEYSDPYMVTVDGHLYWFIDAYTTSSSYPFSEPYSGTKNYIRNSVKVVINAYDGTTDYYIVDDGDPMAKTFQKIYPTLFKELSDMPEGLQAHIRYPSTLLQIQANIYKKYHVNDYKVFYQGEDRWDIAKEKLGASEKEVEMVPQYYVMTLPGETGLEFVNSIPYTPMNKTNMTALFLARNDGENYGEMILYHLPKGKIVMGPSQIDAQISQDATIAQDFSLWASGDSTYLRGNMFVLPVEDSLVYVEPIYLKAAENSLPEVKKIIIYYANRIAYEDTLSEALDAMFGEGVGKALAEASGEQVSPSTPGEGGETTPPADDQQTQLDTLIRSFVDTYNAMTKAEADADWTEYAKQRVLLEGYIKQLESLGITTGDGSATPEATGSDGQ
jgi:uncharacterized membrane protein (UPF0182 family)